MAIIKRNKTPIVNEPHVTGGNPILLGHLPLLEDILGNTVAVRKLDSSISFLERNSFGELRRAGQDYNEGYYHFTGKPEVDGLGFSFLFRNYRPDYGKWHSMDLFLYPDGWNNLSYCNNNFTNAIDLYGAKLFLWVFGDNSFKSFIRWLVDIASTSNTTLGKAIAASSDSVNVHQSNDKWASTTFYDYFDPRINVANFTYHEASTGTFFSAVHAFLHEVGHVLFRNYTDAQINALVIELLNDPAIAAALNDLITRYPPGGIISKDAEGKITVIE